MIVYLYIMFLYIFLEIKDLFKINIFSLHDHVHVEMKGKDDKKDLTPNVLPISTLADLPLEISISTGEKGIPANDIIRLSYEYLLYCYTTVVVPVPTVGIILTIKYEISKTSNNDLDV